MNEIAQGLVYVSFIFVVIIIIVIAVLVLIAIIASIPHLFRFRKKVKNRKRYLKRLVDKDSRLQYILVKHRKESGIFYYL